MPVSGTVGIVLAGGRSRRMGRDKAMLEWRGRTLMAHLRDQLLEAGCSRVVISRNAAGCIADRFPDAGPVAGIHAVVRAVAGGGYLVVPVDMPLLRVSTLRQLRRLGERTGSCHPLAGILPCYLAAPAPGELARILAERLERGARSLGGLLEQLAATAHSLGLPDEYINTNTKKAWDELVNASAAHPVN